MRRPILLLAIILLSSTVVFSLPHTGYPSFSQSNGRLVLADDLLVINDDLVYHRAYYSIDGGDWQPVSLTGAAHKGSSRWLSGGASASLPHFGVGEHYVIAYSCSRGSSSWDCHDGRWQLLIIDNTVPKGRSPQHIAIIGVSASSSQDESHLPELTLDGVASDTSYWGAEGDNQWLVYELNDTATISFVELAFFGQSSRYFDIEYSLDGITFRPVDDEFTSALNSPHVMQRFSFPSVQTRYVRFVGHGSTQSGWNAVSEININDFEVQLQGCQPSCSGRQCGGDACGGTCGSCNDGFTCDAGSCVQEACVPNTNECGSNGCGGQHPVCSVGTCVNGVCETDMDVIWQLDFEHRSVGKYQELSDFQEDWNPVENYWGDRGQDFEIVVDPDDSTNKVGRFVFPFYDSEDFFYICFHRDCYDEDRRYIRFPEEPTFTKGYLQNGVGPGGGGQWAVDLGRGYEELFYSFRIKFSDNFNAVKGGKIPVGFWPDPRPCHNEHPDCLDVNGVNCHKDGCEASLVGCKAVTEPCDGIADDFSAARLMFHDDHLSYYNSHYDQYPITIPDSRTIRDSALVMDGQWHTIVGYARLNDPDQHNGVSRVWIDGEERNPWTGLMYRTGDRSMKMETLKIGTIFGGGTYTRCGVKNVSSCENEVPFAGHHEVCAVDPADPCSEVLRYSDGTPYYLYAPRKTEYIYVDDYVVYRP